MAYIEMKNSTKLYHMGSTTITANDNVSPSSSAHPAQANQQCSTS